MISQQNSYSSPGHSVVSIFLFFAALIVSMILMGTVPAIQIKRPWVLLVASLLGMLSIKRNSTFLLQRIILAYFICMFLSQLAMEKFVIFGNDIRFVIPKSLIPFLLYAACFVIHSMKVSIKVKLKRNFNWYLLWVLAISIILLHMIFLWIFLKSVYGFGYENNINTLNNVLLYCLCFIFTWDVIHDPVTCRLSFACISMLLSIIVFQRF